MPVEGAKLRYGKARRALAPDHEAVDQRLALFKRVRSILGQFRLAGGGDLELRTGSAGDRLAALPIYRDGGAFDGTKRLALGVAAAEFHPRRDLRLQNIGKIEAGRGVKRVLANFLDGAKADAPGAHGAGIGWHHDVAPGDGGQGPGQGWVGSRLALEEDPRPRRALAHHPV